jgi:hypothetical protein
MVTYIYFVKCPNCEDEHFDFFDDAKSFAMSRLSDKPVITQTEVDRNDFGECTDHCDLGTVWSWEEAVGDPESEPVTSITFTKDDIGSDYDPDNDPEFQDDEDFKMINEELLESRRISFNNKEDQQEFFKLCKETGMITGADLDRFMKDYDANDGDLLDKLRAYKDELDNSIDECVERKPIPEGMTIEQLVETMEENEETVECSVCEELFPKTDGVKHGHGYICPTCQNTESEEVVDEEDPFNQEFPETEDAIPTDFSDVEAGRAVADLVVDEFDAISGYDMAAEVIENSEIPEEKQAEILDTLDHIREEEVEHIDELRDIAIEDKEDEVLDEDLDEEPGETIQCAGCEETFPKDECFHKEGIGYLCGDCEDRIVKCTWCDELYDKGECRYEVDLGWLCDRCEAAIKSRGETLTFREGNYWDFLDEKLDLGDIDFSNCVTSSDAEIYGLESTGDNNYKAVLMKRYEDIDLMNFDEPQAVHDEMLKLNGMFVFHFNKSGAPELSSWNPELCNSLSGCNIYFDDERYEIAVARAWNTEHVPNTTNEDSEDFFNQEF